MTALSNRLVRATAAAAAAKQPGAVVTVFVTAAESADYRRTGRLPQHAQDEIDRLPTRPRLIRVYCGIDPDGI